MSNLVEANRLDEELADVLYWVPNPNTFDPEDWDDRVAGVMQRVLHEVQHSSFQGTEYYEMLREAESDPTVQAVVASLGESGGEYIDVTNELITVYVEKLGAERMLEIEGESDRIPLVIEVDKVKHGEILEAVIREDVEKWRGRGPYSDLRQSWEDALGESFPDEGRINGADKVDDEDRSYMGVEIYQRAARLDTKMAREYISQGKPIDREFIIRLYQMLGELGAEVVESSEVIKN